jgi:uncharacterized membrane protein YeaQ/YmgE (transglycosylase-associated protein family)
MALLLWGRYIFLAALGALIMLFVWTAFDTRRER